MEDNRAPVLLFSAKTCSSDVRNQPHSLRALGLNDYRCTPRWPVFPRQLWISRISRWPFIKSPTMPLKSCCWARVRGTQLAGRVATFGNLKILVPSSTCLKISFVAGSHQSKHNVKQTHPLKHLNLRKHTLYRVNAFWCYSFVIPPFLLFLLFSSPSTTLQVFMVSIFYSPLFAWDSCSRYIVSLQAHVLPFLLLFLAIVVVFFSSLNTLWAMYVSLLLKTSIKTVVV